MNNFKLSSIFVLIFALGYHSILFSSEWLIVADALSFSEEQIRAEKENRMVVSLDGATDYFQKFNIVPNVILGDFDSIKDTEYWGIKNRFNEISDDSKPYSGHFGTLIVPAKDQTRSDLEKGICYCDSQEAKAIYIVNATGGRTDHTLSNFSLLKKYHNLKRPIVILSEHESIEFVENQARIIKGEIGAQVAVIGFPLAHMTTFGLKYNGEDFKCELGARNSPCNTLALSEAIIKIKGDAIIINQKFKGDAYKKNR